MTHISDFKKMMAESLAGFRSKLEADGLTNPDKIPTPRACPKCAALVPPRWTATPFGHWRLGGVEDCATCSNERHAERGQQRAEKAFDRARVPMRLRGLSFRELTADRSNRQLVEACHGWDGRRWLIVAGGVGTGKTTWLTALLLDHLRANPSSRSLWTSEQRLYRKAQLRGDKTHAGRERVIQEAVDAEVLLLDDLGAGRRELTEWQGGAMRDLLTERHLEGRPTFITTNLGEDAIAQQYGEHVASRLVEAAGEFVNLGGTDRRRSAKNSFFAWWSRGM